MYVLPCGKLINHIFSSISNATTSYKWPFSIAILTSPEGTLWFHLVTIGPPAAAELPGISAAHGGTGPRPGRCGGRGGRAERRARGGAPAAMGRGWPQVRQDMELGKFMKYTYNFT